MRKDSQLLKCEKNVLLAFAVLFFAIAFFRTVLRTRYISPIIPPLTLLSVMGIKKIMDGVGDLKGGGTACAVIIRLFSALIFSSALNARCIFYQLRYLEPFASLRGRVTQDAYVTKHRNEYPALFYINGHLPSNALVLFVFVGNREYYGKKEYIFDEHLMEEVFPGAKRPEEMVRMLRDKGDYISAHLWAPFRKMDPGQSFRWRRACCERLL